MPIEFTEERLETWRQAQLGKTLSEETKQKISQAMKGKKLSDETKAKMSEVRKGRPLNEKNKEGISQALRGKKRSPEHVQAFKDRWFKSKTLPNFVADVRTGDCWEWLKPRKGRGPSRPVFEKLVGPVPKGLCVCHSCDNTFCVRPSHLWVGTPKENTMDMVTKGRHGLAGKPFTEEMRQKWREASLGQKAWNKGVAMSDEQKKKISESTRGRVPWNKGKKAREFD